MAAAAVRRRGTHSFEAAPPQPLPTAEHGQLCFKFTTVQTQLNATTAVWAATCTPAEAAAGPAAVVAAGPPPAPSAAAAQLHLLAPLVWPGLPAA